MSLVADTDLVIQFQNGDRRSFTLLYERHKDGVYAYCYRMLVDAQAAEDAAQETFLKMLDGIRTLQHPESFRPWLYRIARNEVYMSVRRRRPERLDEDTQIADDHPDPHDILVLRERHSLLQRSLLALQQEYREVLLLCEYDGLSYAEIAEVTGSSESAVRTRIFRARQQLAHRFKAQYS